MQVQCEVGKRPGTLQLSQKALAPGHSCQCTLLGASSRAACEQTQEVPQLEQCHAQPSPTQVAQVHKNIVPSSFATSAIRRHHAQESEQMSSVISQRLSFFILTPGKKMFNLHFAEQGI